jgi:class 3 adenylate cyclase
VAFAPLARQDISGFSHLNEYFAQLGGVGLGKMMALLNVYFQKMIKICTSCGGDVIKFAGDALIVLWVNEPLAKLAHRACECALELQDSLHDTEITPEISLSLKVGVGLGSATMFYVGGHADRFEYFAAGPALKECFSAADVAEKGDVIVASSVFEQVRDACQAERMQDGHYCVMAMRQTFRKRALNRVCTPALTPQALAVLRSYAPPVLLHASELEKQLKQTVRSWTVSVVHASIIFIHFGIEGVMDLLALDSAKVQ